MLAIAPKDPSERNTNRRHGEADAGRPSPGLYNVAILSIESSRLKIDIVTIYWEHMQRVAPTGIRSTGNLAQNQKELPVATFRAYHEKYDGD